VRTLAGDSGHEDPTDEAPATEASGADVLDSGEAGGKAIRGGVAVTASYIAGLLISLAAVPFMIRYLGVVEYGYYITVSAAVLIIGGITEAGLTNLGVREYAVRTGVRRDVFMRSLIGLRLLLTTVGVAIAVALAAGTGAKAVIVKGTVIAGLGLLIQLMQQTYMIPLNAELRLGAVAVLGIVKQVTLSLMFIALVVAGAGLLAFFWASVAMGLVLMAVTVALVRGIAPVLPVFHWHMWRGILAETLPYAVAAAVGLIYLRIAIVLMAYVSTAEQTGYLSAAFRIVEVLAALPWLLVSAAFPILARAARNDDGTRFSYGLQRVFEVATVVGVLLALGLAIAAPVAIEVVAGPGFAPSIPVLRIQALGLVTGFLMVTWSFALLSLKLYRALLLSNALAAAVAIAGTLVLAPAFDARGAAAATVLSEAVLAVACWIALRRARPDLSLNHGVVVKAAAAAVPGILIALVLPLPSVVLAALAGAIYLAIAFATGAVPGEVLTAMLRRDRPVPIEQ
jgi:O-antigen/teichoic acid export membrane protein